MARRETRVSVIIPAYNEEDVIAGCVYSILKNSFKNVEILVVDDGSSDRTAEIVRSMKDKRVKLVSLDRNSGAARARNVGIDNAKGSVIILTDADCVVSKNWILEHLKSLDEYDCVIGSSTPTSVEDNITSRAFYLVAKEKWSRIGDTIMSAITANGSFRRGIFDKIRFDESFRTAAYEDMDFMLMLDKAGFKRGYNSKANIKHLFHETVNGQLRRAFRSSGAFNVFARKHRTKRKTALQAISVFSTVVFPLLLPFSFLLALKDSRYFFRVSRKSGFKYLLFMMSFETMRNAVFSVGITYHLLKGK